MSSSDLDAKYLNIILEPIRVCAKYKPKFGRGRGAGYSLVEFQRLYQADPFYSWFGLDNPLMYAAHKAAGGMTSVYRQIGIGCEHLFREILEDHLGLAPEDARWSYEVQVSGGRSRRLHLDGRIEVAKVRDPVARGRIEAWIREAAVRLDVDTRIAESLTGAVFEVRQGYKSKDSKRQNADLANAATAYTKTYLPCGLILSSQIDSDILLRYKSEKWFILTGIIGAEDPLVSTFDFVKAVIGYDLAGFFTRNSPVFKREVDAVLRALLSTQ